MSKGKNIHVVPRNDRWVVRKEGSSRPSSVHTTQREAIEKAREAARNLSAELIIHRSDGRVGSRDSYSNDPLPPKGYREVLFPENLSSTGRKAIRKAVDAVVRESRNSSRGFSTSRRGWQHVIPHEGGWAVRGEGNSRATSIHNTQREAIEAAREIARNQNGQLLIHGRNGQIRERDSTGSNDSYSQKG